MKISHQSVEREAESYRERKKMRERKGGVVEGEENIIITHLLRGVFFLQCELFLLNEHI